MWGEPGEKLRVVEFLRTIPTHVGRTRRPPPAGNPAADHPHARGENIFPSRLIVVMGGPSPRTWGEP